MQPSNPVTTAVTASLSAWDCIGIGLSGLCMAHCLIVPLFLVALPLWAGTGLHEWLHPAFALTLLPLTLGVRRTLRGQTNATSIRGLLGAGALVVALASVLGPWEGSGIAETAGTMLGSGMLIAGHWRNRSTRACAHQA